MGFLLSACIKEYKPEISRNEINKYVVFGQLTNEEGFQEVTVSYSSTVGDPKFIPVKNCVVIISDDKGNQYTLTEYQSGYYHVWMPQSSLTAGTAYKVDVTTKPGDHISSAFDLMPMVPEIDSVYYQLKDIPTNDPDNPLKGIQFYIDYNGAGTNSTFVKWDLTETWEYHATYPITFYFDGAYHQVDPPDYSKKVCWSTVKLDNIFTLSTQNLVENKYKMFPLHFIDNHTARLAYGYSLLIRQLSLSENAYIYWDQVRINHTNGNGMYQQQPLAVKGNMVNLSKPDDEVLGYFNASSVKSKRIFVNHPESLNMDFSDFCGGPVKMELGWADGASPSNPVYLIFVDGSLKVLDNTCCDCLLIGGTNVKPDFWPN
jgi:hypothetical protein